MAAQLTTFGITGAGGFLAWHLRARLHIEPRIEVRLADRATFSGASELDKFLAGCDVVVHLAGANRGEPSDVVAGNVAPAQALADAKARIGARFLLVYTNSAKAGEAGPYGESKQQAGEILAQAQQGAGDPFVDLVLPHLFGEHGRPFYNSAVATFAYQLANGESPEIIVDTELDLIHAQEAATAILEAVAGGTSATLRLRGTSILVSDALSLLQRLARPYLSLGEVPEMPGPFEARMFNMVRSHLFPAHCPIPLSQHRDHRGTFFETIRSGGKGQASISSTAPGVTRGEHFHFDKFERFVVVGGEALIRIRRLFGTSIREYRVSGNHPVAVDMPTLHPHNITNVGDGELITQFWTNDLFDPTHPDTFAEPV